MEVAEVVVMRAEAVEAVRLRPLMVELARRLVARPAEQAGPSISRVTQRVAEAALRPGLTVETRVLTIRLAARAEVEDRLEPSPLRIYL
jgi:hypothetical protein